MLIVIHETKPYENLFISAYPSFSMPMSNNHHSEESRARKLVYILSGRGVLYIYIWNFLGFLWSFFAQRDSYSIHNSVI